ncbi:MAG: TIGR03854 family LLM class F420-dependent oxidoreductase, partial [Acidimicrobiaceae bacterium]|nr:TIGR03854 family LLM class F420-dependent oxidoreductase [Acidimicrobiaceae bacterium]
IRLVSETATAHGRSIDPEHFGALVPFVHGAIPQRFAQRLRTRQPDLDPAEIVASGIRGLRSRLEEFISAGASKFVAFPLDEPDDWHSTVVEVADELLPLQT